MKTNLIAYVSTLQFLTLCFLTIVEGRGYSIIKATNGNTGGTLLVFKSKEEENLEFKKDLLSAVYCPLGSPSNQEMNDCKSHARLIFSEKEPATLSKVFLRLLPEVETRLEESDHKVHVRNLNTWHTEHNFLEFELKRADLNRKLGEINASLSELGKVGVQEEKIENSELAKKKREVAHELKVIHDLLLPIEPSRSAISHEIETLLELALDESVHPMAALSPSIDLKQVILAILSERENLKFSESVWSGFVLDLDVITNLRQKNYVVSSEPGSEVVTFFACIPKLEPKGCLEVSGRPSIRISKNEFMTSAESLGLAVDELIGQAYLENQYRVTPPKDEIRRLLQIFNRSQDRDKDFEGVDLENGKHWWKAYESCSRLKADQLEQQNPRWKLPTLKQLQQSRTFLLNSGWMKKDNPDSTIVWNADKPTMGLGQQDNPYTRAVKSNTRVDWSVRTWTVAWQMRSPATKLEGEGEFKDSAFFNDVSSSSMDYLEWYRTQSQVRKQIAESDWRHFSAHEAVAAAWLIADY